MVYAKLVWEVCGLTQSKHCKRDCEVLHLAAPKLRSEGPQSTRVIGRYLYYTYTYLYFTGLYLYNVREGRLAVLVTQSKLVAQLGHLQSVQD